MNFAASPDPEWSPQASAGEPLPDARGVDGSGTTAAERAVAASAAAGFPAGSSAATAGPVIELRDIVKDYRRVRALDGITLTLHGGITGLLGPNGAGKTTLIKVLLGLVRLSGGSGTVLGFDLRTQARTIRQNVGFMPEDDCYITGLSGVEMVQFAARLSGLPAVEALRRSHEILDFCGVEQERYRNVDTYSTGMRQKVKFAQAIVHDPPLLILDEPTAGLDPDERVAMLHRIGLLAHRAGKAVLVSTHILPDVRAICDTVVIVARGELRVIDSLESLSRPASPAIQLRTVADPEPLLRRIEQEGGAVQRDDTGMLRVTLTMPEATDRLWQWARETGVGIRSLTPSRNSLEQIFMDAVRGDRRADS
jgi:ABC-2 type transport system ATP-binding protein